MEECEYTSLGREGHGAKLRVPKRVGNVGRLGEDGEGGRIFSFSEEDTIQIIIVQVKLLL